jgi:tetratricopeptide (TPR) repeat protein
MSVGRASPRKSEARNPKSERRRIDANCANSADDSWSGQTIDPIHCRQAVHANSPEAKACRDRGQAYCQRQEWDLAIAELGKAIQLDPGDFLAYDYRANAFVRKGDFAEAIADLDQAIQLNPRDAVAYTCRGLACLEKRNLEDAIADFSHAVQLDPLDTAVAAHFNRGSAYAAAGRLDKAISDYTESLWLHPTNDLAYRSRGFAYAEEAELSKAIRDYTKCLRINPKDAVAYRARTGAYDRRGSIKKAIIDYTEALHLDQKDAESASNRGWDYFLVGRFEEALADDLNATRLDPRNQNAYNNFAWLRATCALAAIRNGTQAVEMATRACDLSRWREATFLDTLASAYAESRDFEHAIRYENQALDMSQSNKAAQEAMRRHLRLYEQHQPFHSGQEQ